MSYNIKRFFKNFDHLQVLDSITKVGVNLFTAGAVGLFITSQLNFVTGKPSVWLILIGSFAMAIGALKKGDK